MFSYSNLTSFKLLQPNQDPSIDAPTIGKVILKSRGFFTDAYWYWISISALFAFSILFNILFIGALTYLNRELSYLFLIWGFLNGIQTSMLMTLLLWKIFSAFGDPKSIVIDENGDEKDKKQASSQNGIEGYFLPLFYPYYQYTANCTFEIQTNNNYPAPSSKSNLQEVDLFVCRQNVNIYIYIYILLQ